jgi:hypothetical protein
MTKLKLCLQRLDVLVAKNDPNSIGSAERAIDELIGSVPEGKRVPALSALKSGLLKITENAPPGFGERIFSYIESKERGLPHRRQAVKRHLKNHLRRNARALSGWLQSVILSSRSLS